MMNHNPIPPSGMPLSSRQFLLGVACFSALCSHYTLQLVYTQPGISNRKKTMENTTHKPQVRWADAEVLCLLQYLITVRSRLCNASIFPTSICAATAAHVMNQFPLDPRLAWTLSTNGERCIFWWLMYQSDQSTPQHSWRNSTMPSNCTGDGQVWVGIPSMGLTFRQNWRSVTGTSRSKPRYVLPPLKEHAADSCTSGVKTGSSPILSFGGSGGQGMI